MSRPALIFDFGNVIAYFSFEKATEKLGGELGLTGRELLDRLGPLGFRQHLAEYERGRISAVEFVGRISALVQLRINHDEFAAAWADIFTANESILPIIADLKAQGYQLLLGSNTNDIHAAQFRDQFASTMMYFDHLILSYEIGHIKPSREFYEACARAAKVQIGDCIFIDDLSENVTGARYAGMKGILYDRPSILIKQLAGLEVYVNVDKQSQFYSEHN